MPQYQPPSKEVLKALETAPNMYLVLSPDLFILTASDLYLEAVETILEDIVGRHIFEAFPDNPEVNDVDGSHNINASLQEVLRTKRPHHMAIQKYDVPDRKQLGKFIERYWDPSHTPVLDEHGEIHYIIQLATNVTQRVMAEQALAMTAEAQQLSLDEITVLNEELAATNEELLSAVEDLQDSDKLLQQLNSELENRVRTRTSELEKSSGRFQSVVELSPVPIIIYKGRDMLIEIANQAMLELLGQDNAVIGKSLRDLLSQGRGERILDALLHCYQTGSEWTDYEVPLQLKNEDVPVLRYFTINYKPWREAGEISGVMQTAVEVTHELQARRQIERAEQNLRYAAEAGRMGTWYIKPDTKELEYNGMLAEIFGYEGNSKMTYEQAIGQVLEEFRNPIQSAIDKAIADSGNYEFRYQQRRFNDGKIIWLRSVGKIMQDEKGESSLFSGVVIDITPQMQGRKALEQYQESLLKQNEELSIAQQEAVLQRNRLTSFLMQAPGGICVLEGEDLVYEFVNRKYQELFPGRKLLGKPLLEALPELGNTPIYDILLNVYRTGETFETTELLVPLQRFSDGPIEERYFSFVYQPRVDVQNQIDGILVFVYELTEQVNARHRIEQAEESLRLATEAAHMGSFSINVRTMTLSASPRLRELFGFGAREEMSYDAAILQIREDYQNSVRNKVQAVVQRSERFELEYPIVGRQDGKERWVKAVGSIHQKSKLEDKYFTGVIIDITEQRKDDQRKNDFIGMVSHELKTPLTSMSGYIQLLQLQARKKGETGMLSMLDRATAQAGKMAKMINGFLNMSRLESGKIHIDKTNFDLSELLKEMEEETLATITSHHIVFAPVERTPVVADRDKIGQVINNLISNAVKYSPNRSTINVACITVGEFATLGVKDQGMGVPAGDIERLFDRYYRVEGEHMKSIAGFGIGLYLCKEIIERHNGSIWVESELGKGSSFFFNLPIAQRD